MPSPKGAKARRSIRARMQDPSIIQAIDLAFRDLRADFELASDGTDPDKLVELRTLNVETGLAAHLQALAGGSSGLITGLRGTGKTHLLMLAQDSINAEPDPQTLAVYVNLKRLRTVVQGHDTALLERMFILMLASAVRREVWRMVSQAGDHQGWGGLLKAWLARRKAEARAERATELLDALEEITRGGEAALRMLGEADLTVNDQLEEEAARTQLTKVQAALSLEAGLSHQAERSRRTKKVAARQEKMKQARYISASNIRTLLVQVVQALGLRSMVFFFDEWSKLPRTGQEQLAGLIDSSLVDDPIFVWCAAVTHDYTFGEMELAADLQHHIALDRQLIYERNPSECRQFFSEFVNRRLRHYTGDPDFAYDNFIRNYAFERLVIASMGNARDFGIMLQDAWLRFKQQTAVEVDRGGTRPWYVGLRHVDPAIYQHGRTKLANLEGQDSTPYARRLWEDLKALAQERRHTHFCVPNSPAEAVATEQDEVRYLLKQRLIHLREEELSVKEAGPSHTLRLYALDFSALGFDRNSALSTSRQVQSAGTAIPRRTRSSEPLQFVVDWETVHDKVRRYVASFDKILAKYRVERGEQHDCLHCGHTLHKSMAWAWNQQTCPNCGENPFINQKRSG